MLTNKIFNASALHRGVILKFFFLTELSQVSSTRPNRAEGAMV